MNNDNLYPFTSYDQLKQTIADTHAQLPPSLPPGYLVPLEEAPAGPDLGVRVDDLETQEKGACPPSKGLGSGSRRAFLLFW